MLSIPLGALIMKKRHTINMHTIFFKRVTFLSTIKKSNLYFLKYSITLLKILQLCYNCYYINVLWASYITNISLLPYQLIDDIDKIKWFWNGGLWANLRQQMNCDMWLFNQMIVALSHSGGGHLRFIILLILLYCIVT